MTHMRGLVARGWGQTSARWVSLIIACCWLAAGCASLSGELHRVELLYKDARYEEAQLWLSDLERQAAAMSKSDLARLYYLRGMTAFRLGQHDDALHFLVLADRLNAEDSGRLPEGWQPVMERTLAEIMPASASPHARNPVRPDTM
jgi:hypothetical protein